MESAVYQVSAFWDKEAAVWVATSEDIPGLATEANTIEALSQKLRDIVPDLLVSNHVIPLIMQVANGTGNRGLDLD
jgi:predicted RNase H-like HicB family nuclease